MKRQNRELLTQNVTAESVLVASAAHPYGYEVPGYKVPGFPRCYAVQAPDDSSEAGRWVAWHVTGRTIVGGYFDNREDLFEACAYISKVLPTSVLDEDEPNHNPENRLAFVCHRALQLAAQCGLDAVKEIEPQLLGAVN